MLGTDYGGFLNVNAATARGSAGTRRLFGVPGLSGTSGIQPQLNFDALMDAFDAALDFVADRLRI